MTVINFPLPRDRPVSPARKAVEDEIERLIAILDLVDGDPNLEDAGDDEPEPLEPYLADAASDLEEGDDNGIADGDGLVEQRLGWRGYVE